MGFRLAGDGVIRVTVLADSVTEFAKQVADLRKPQTLSATSRLLLLDEPGMGLASLLVDAIRESGTTVLLVEQNARQTLKISGEAIVLSHGRIFRVGKGPNSSSIPPPSRHSWEKHGTTGGRNRM